MNIKEPSAQTSTENKKTPKGQKKSYSLHFEIKKKPLKKKVDPDRVLKRIQRSERKKYQEIQFNPVMLSENDKNN